MLYTNDGSDFLKRVLKQRIGDDLDPDDNVASVQCSSELPTMQFVGGDWYLSREYIDRFTGDVLKHRSRRQHGISPALL